MPPEADGKGDERMTTLASPELIGLRIEEPTLADAAMMMEVQFQGWYDEAAKSGLTERATVLHAPYTSFRSYCDAVGERLGAAGAYMRVVRQGEGGLVAGILDADIDGEMNWNDALYLRPCLQRRGLGSLMLAGFERYLDEIGNTAPIGLKVLTGNEPAKRMYEKNGYREVLGSLRYNGYLSHVTMVKRRGEAA